MEILVLGGRRMQFEGNRGAVDICKVSYVEGRDDSDEMRGCMPITANATPAVFDQIKESPGLFDVIFSQRPDSKGKPVVTVTSALLIKKVALEGVTF